MKLPARNVAPAAVVIHATDENHPKRSVSLDVVTERRSALTSKIAYGLAIFWSKLGYPESYEQASIDDGDYGSTNGIGHR